MVVLNKHNKDLSFYAVVLFATVWLCAGNLWSLLASYSSVHFSPLAVFLYAVIYLMVTTPVILFFFKELMQLKSKFKFIILLQVFIFLMFVIAPPRNADAMRVWLPKVYDVWLYGSKIVRPYLHFHTPDAFSLFHVPLINLWDGQIFQFSIWVALCATLIMLIKIGRVYLTDGFMVLGLFLFLFNPFIILGSTAVLTDVPMYLAVAGLLYAMILYEQRRFDKSLIFVMLFLAFGMNIKYNMMMLLPVVTCWLVIKVWTNGINWKTFPLVFIFIGLAILPYYLNYLNIGNPVWPACIEFFPSKYPHWDVMARAAFDGFVGGERTLWNFVLSFFRLFILPHHINPLAMFTIFFVFVKYKHLHFWPGIMVAVYLFILWLMMPEFSVNEKERYVLYLFPIIIPLGLATIQHIFSKVKYGQILKKIFVGGVGATMLVYAGFTAVYSQDVVLHAFTHDKARWHRATWYYDDYQWINKEISLDGSGKILVLVQAGPTYYLRKPWLNADPTSALIDWKAATDLNSIMDMMRKYEVQYIFVDDDFLKTYSEAQKAIDILVENGAVEVVRKNIVKLSHSRIRKKYSDHTTILYRVKY